MTKSLIPLLLCLIFNLQLYAQTDNTVAIPEDCYDIIVPDTAAYIMFAMKKSDLKVHTFKTGECLWHTKYKPETHRIYAGNNGVFITKPTPLSLKRKNETRLLDYRNGEELHKYDVLPALIDEDNDILIGYKGDNNNKLFGYKISSGEELWKTKIEKNYGDPWDLIVSSKSDSSIICLGNHIWKVNIYTGDRLEYKLKRRIQDKKTNAGLIGLSVLTALFAGTVVYGPTYFDGFGSEPIIDDNGHIFAADRDAVVCLDYNLNEVWRYQLPKGIGSKSYLFLQGDTLRMINTGTAVTGSRTRKIGEPFFASFDKNTGSNINILRFPKKWDKTIFNENLDFVTDTVYSYNPETDSLTPLFLRKNSCPIIGTNGDILYVNEDLEIQEKFDAISIFLKLGTISDGSTMLVHWEEGAPAFYMAIDDTGKICSRHGSTEVSFISLGNKLFKTKNGMIITK